MRNLLTFLSRNDSSNSQASSSRHLNQPRGIFPFKSSSLFASMLLGVTLWYLFPRPTVAAPPETAPDEIKTLLTDLDHAANQRDVEAVMKFYSETFINSDGLNRQSLQKALAQLWERYPNITYHTELQSWETQGNAVVAETVTQITGTQSLQNRDVSLKTTIRSQQRYEAKKIVHQEILAEQTQLTLGDNPPTVTINAPEAVKVGEEFNFDAIVQEPLGEQLLLGGAFEEPILEKTYFSPPPLELDLLSAGGIFKIGTAPAKPESSWLSAILVRQGGITMITHRLRVVQ